jgi:uncharacterized protein involved in exopolysaccharide biosynthesis
VTGRACPWCRRAAWWIVASTLLVPALIAGIALDAAVRFRTEAQYLLDCLHDWAYQEQGS